MQVRYSELADGFQTPPESAKAWTYWWWLKGWIDEEGIRADLDHMVAGPWGDCANDAVNNPGIMEEVLAETFASAVWRGHCAFILASAISVAARIA